MTLMRFFTSEERTDNAVLTWWKPRYCSTVRDEKKTSPSQVTTNRKPFSACEQRKITHHNTIFLAAKHDWLGPITPYWGSRTGCDLRYQWLCVRMWQASSRGRTIWPNFLPSDLRLACLRWEPAEKSVCGGLKICSASRTRAKVSKISSKHKTRTFERASSFFSQSEGTSLGRKFQETEWSWNLVIFSEQFDSYWWRHEAKALWGWKVAWWLGPQNISASAIWHLFPLVRNLVTSLAWTRALGRDCSGHFISFAATAVCSCIALRDKFLKGTDTLWLFLCSTLCVLRFWNDFSNSISAHYLEDTVRVGERRLWVEVRVMVVMLVVAFQHIPLL